MRWFGGATGVLGTARTPAGARLLTAYPATWIVGDWPAGQVRTVRHAGGTLVVVGPCSATAAELARLPAELPDSAATAWSGAYTMVLVTPDGSVCILTDPACARPVYTARTGNNGIVWASSSRALAGLIGAPVDESWLAAGLAAPVDGVAGRSAWEGVGLIPPGHRYRIRAGHPPVLRPAWRPPAGRIRSAEPLRTALDAAVDCRIGGGAAALDLPASWPSTVAGVAEPLYADVHELPATDEPAPSTPGWRRLAAELRTLSAAGLGCLLAGDGGSRWPGLRGPALARAGHTRSALPRARPGTTWTRPGTTWTRPGGTWTRLRGPAGRSWMPGLTPVGRELAASVLDAAPDREPGHTDRLLAGVRHAARTAHADAQLADAFGIALEHPCLDPRVVEIALAARAAPWPDPMPPALPPAGRGVRLNLRQLLDLADGELADRKIVDPGWLTRQVRRAALGLDDAWDQVAALLTAEVWLRRVSASPPVRWVAADS